MNRENKRILILLSFFCIAFTFLVVYLSYFQIFKAESIKNNPYNKRLWVNEDNVIRGSIYDRNNKLLAYNNRDTNSRIYEFDSLYSHVIGYSYREYGKTGLELKYNEQLINQNIIQSNKMGNSLILTIDHNMQLKSKELLKGKKGSIITMNPKNGEIYSMVSLPDFNTNNLQENWKSIIERQDSPLLNRATQGLYSPGSTFKILSTIAFLESGIDLNYTCNGESNIDGYVFKNFGNKSYGNIGIEEAFTYSVNTYYTDKSLEVGIDMLGDISERLNMNKNINFDLATKASRFNYKGDIEKTEIAASFIGQGKVLVTPLNMALITSTIANNGDSMEPILVKEIIDENNRRVKTISSRKNSQLINKEVTYQIQDMMLDVVRNGTGKNAGLNNFNICGKTGTAENSSGKNHSWFVGYGPYEDPELVVVVILEEDGRTGGQGAAPIARELFRYGLTNIK